MRDAPFGYCGEYTDSESGLVYLRNRYYDPSTGSFITEDPVKDGNNWYGYCAGNPVMYIDKLGLFSKATILSKESKNNNQDDIIKLQVFLSSKKLLSDKYKYGVFDTYTLEAVNRYKDNNNIYNSGSSRGKVGVTTWAKMGLEFDLYSDDNEYLAEVKVYENAMAISAEKELINQSPTSETSLKLAKKVKEVYKTIYSKEYKINTTEMSIEIYAHAKVYQDSKNNRNTIVGKFLWEHCREINIGNTNPQIGKQTGEIDRYLWNVLNQALYGNRVFISKQLNNN